MSWLSGFCICIKVTDHGEYAAGLDLITSIFKSTFLQLVAKEDIRDINHMEGLMSSLGLKTEGSMY